MLDCVTEVLYLGEPGKYDMDSYTISGCFLVEGQWVCDHLQEYHKTSNHRS